MRLVAIALALVSLSSLADARPFSAGVALGKTQRKDDANLDANETLGVFGRLGFTPRVSGQLELQKIKGPSSDGYYAGQELRTMTGLLVVDLGQGGTWMPMLLVGMGVDHQSDAFYGSDLDGTHIEGGFGLEYRADGGLTVGVDLRMGGRSVDNTDQPVILDAGQIELYAPTLLQDGEYRSARLYAAVRF